MKILDLVNGQVVIKPECLAISPFSELWTNDKTKDKTQANEQIKYVWFFSDFNSPYFSYPEQDRGPLIVRDVLKNKKFKETKDVTLAINKYKELHSTPAIRAVETAGIFLEKLENYFKTVDLSEVRSPKIVSDMFISFPGMVSTYNTAVEKAYKEETSSTKVRGGKSLGMFEDEP